MTESQTKRQCLQANVNHTKLNIIINSSGSLENQKSKSKKSKVVCLAVWQFGSLAKGLCQTLGLAVYIHTYMLAAGVVEVDVWSLELASGTGNKPLFGV